MLKKAKTNYNHMTYGNYQEYNDTKFRVLYLKKQILS